MTARSMLPDHPAPRVRHGWRCVRRGPLVETVRTDPTGRAHVVEMCTECNDTDLLDRIRTEHEPT